MVSLYNYYVTATPAFSSSPIWMFGRKFDPETTEVNGVASVSFTRFLENYNNILWFSYRSYFPAIEDSLYTSDAGWGCMLRSGQMMLAQALVNHRLGRGWEATKGEPLPPAIYEIVKLFGDNPTPAHPFSIHAIASIGRKYGKTIGEWFAPSTISFSLSDLVATHKPEGLKIIVSEDGALYLDKVAQACTSHHTSSKGKEKEGEGADNDWHGAVIMVPLRLGLDTMNPVYYQPILELFQFPQSLGIVGGKPRASLYFIAAQDDSVFFLDPHVVQTAVNTDEEFTIDTFHTTCTRKMNINELDPSLVLAFHCKDKPDFEDFVRRMNELTEKYKEAILFTIENKAPDYQEKGCLVLDEDDDADMVML